MNCTEFQEVVHDLAREADLSRETRRAALAHADSCSRCDELFAQSQSLTAALRALATKDGAAEAAPRVERVLVDAFRQNRNRAARAPLPLRWGIAGVAALAALVLLSALGLRHRVISPPTHDGGAGSSAAVQRATSGTSLAPAAAAPDGADTEYADAFVSLPFTDEPAGDEIIVRQAVSRSALANFGLPVSEADANDTIVADFVVDEDGTPRAVRIVQ
ncbi:MAG TPA: hypothetical protein VEJ39_06645 [Candidatus Acidoferrales bacterium]|nr:hypothetical protein [Candidatus Acidoferrales bacterium]